MNIKTKRIILLLIIAVVMIVLCVRYDDRTTKFVMLDDGVLGIEFTVGTETETILPYYLEEDDVYVFFMPNLLSKKTIFDGDLNLLVNEEKINLLKGFCWEEGNIYEIKIEDRSIKAKFMQSSNIGTMIFTLGKEGTQKIDEDKSLVEQMSLNVIDANGSIAYSGDGTITARGNSTFSVFEKKPYNIKLNTSASILGLEKEKSFCLLANSYDYSYMNNKLAFDMAENSGMKFAVGAEYADVYINGEYRGIYLVAEKVKIGENRVDIVDLEEENEKLNTDVDFEKLERFDYGNIRGVKLPIIPNDISGGYIIERDYRLSPEYKNRVFSTSYFETIDYGTSINVKSPTYASYEEVSYLRDIVSEMEQAIMSEEGYSDNGKYYLDYIDLFSWVNYYLLAEIAYDLDKDVTNAYYYKNIDSIDDKFYMGPAWDFDCRFGGSSTYYRPDILTKLDWGKGWIYYLYDKKEFNDEVKQLWKTYYNNYLENEAPNKIEAWRELIKDSVEMDLVRWNRSENYPVKWPQDDYTDAFSRDYDFNKSVDYLKKWLEERRVFLNSCWTD